MGDDMSGESLCIHYVHGGPCVPLCTTAGTGRREIAKYNIVMAYREVVVKNLENDPELDACEIVYIRTHLCGVFIRSFRYPLVSNTDDGGCEEVLLLLPSRPIRYASVHVL